MKGVLSPYTELRKNIMVDPEAKLCRTDLNNDGSLNQPQNGLTNGMGATALVVARS